MNKEYHKNYYETHKDEWYKKIKCDVCDSSYSRASKHTHFNTKKHKEAVKYKELQDKLTEAQKYGDIEKKMIDAEKYEEIEKKLNDAMKYKELEKKLDDINKNLKIFTDSLK